MISLQLFSLIEKQEELESIPAGANLGVSCGNPLAHAHLKEGEVVVDLGSGAGLDCFIAAPKVGSTGKVCSFPFYIYYLFVF